MDLFGLRPISLQWGLDQEFLISYLVSMHENEKNHVTGLEAVFSLHLGSDMKLGYLNSADIYVDIDWIENNKDRFAFYSRGDLRKVAMFDKEIEILKKVYEL